MPQKSLTIVIPSGQPSGLRKVQIGNWSGRCYIIPRQQLHQLDELHLNSGSSNPALYFLFGKDEVMNSSLAYIGETENFFRRLDSHSTEKEYWNEAVVFTGSLNKAHIKYLEYKAVQLARRAGRMDIKNSTAPSENQLSEVDLGNMEEYFEYVKFALGVLNYDVFEVIADVIVTGTSYYLKGKDFQAEARRLDTGGMLVLAGAHASIHQSNSFGGWSEAARIAFLADGTLRQVDNFYELTRDVVFKSPSAAAATISARSINGWFAWRDARHNTLDYNVRKSVS